uniref:TonB-dependent receptor n=1 Tax=Roseihalotalea indica TaxID=2867963 RepID=A0AA49GQ38_9BACT|nr:TonB-dependent receptor [Tunicatimonas sp. TK19036]
MSLKQSFLIGLALLLILPAYSQNITQTIRGRVIDSETLQPLEGTSVYLRDTDPPLGATTDTQGNFLLENVPIGRHILKTSYVGYQSYTIPDLLVQSGKETVLEITLTPSAQNLNEVVVEEQRTPPEAIEPLSSRSFTVEETRRYAATFFDPARLATSFPGVVGVNDQANHISVRGNSPNSLLWRLEGIDIVNPNHLSNAGTFSDRRASSSGSQSILSTQMLDNSHFLTGAFPAQYGNAIGGAFDIRLRRGNNQQREYTVQAGLIGLEFAAEGPFAENSASSYLVNYRYSTVGLLTNVLGIDFGGEQITFQDLSFNLTFPTQKAGTFTVFGIGGTGSNVFNASRDSSAWETQKDRYDITFGNDMGAVGATHTISLNERTSLKSVVAASALSSERFGDILTEDYATQRLEEDQYQEVRLSITSAITHKLSERRSITGGFFLTYMNYDLSSNEGDSIGNTPQTLISGEGDGLLIQPYVQHKWQLTDRLSWQAGLHYTHFSLNGSQSLEPRTQVQWTVSPQQSVRLAYGLHSQMQLPGVYFSTIPTDVLGAPRPQANLNLGLTKAHHYVLGYDYQVSETSRIRTEAYYQSLFNVPISTNSSSSFSTLNLFEGFVDEALVNEGTGKNYGIELTAEKSLSDSYYFLLSSSIYESKYTGADGIQRDTRFNGNYAVSFTGGKEFLWQHSEKQRVIGINLRANYLGGLRTTPIDAAASQASQTTVFQDDLAYSQQLPAYFKIDLRISLRKNTDRFTSVWSLDLQNALNQQNVAFQYYDVLQQKVVTKYQLGLIPVLTYRIEF